MNVEVSLLALAVLNLLICLWVGRHTVSDEPASDDMTWLQARANAVTTAHRAAEANARAAWLRGDDDSRRFWMRVQDICADELRDVAPAMKAVRS